jgi:hypothetical protein
MATAPPILASDPSLSGIGLFYVPMSPVPNPGAEFLANFTRRRLQVAQQMFAARLRALDPSARYDAMAKLADTRQKHLAQLAESERARARNEIDAAASYNGLIGKALDYKGNEVRARAGIQEAQIGLEGNLIQARQVRTEAARNVVADVRDILGTTQLRLEEARRAGDKDAEDRALDQLSRRIANAELAAQDLQPMEREAVASEVQQALGGFQLNDPQLRDDVMQLVTPSFQPQSEIPIGRYGVSAPPLGDVVREAQALQLMGPPDQVRVRSATSSPIMGSPPPEGPAVAPAAPVRAPGGVPRAGPTPATAARPVSAQPRELPTANADDAIRTAIGADERAAATVRDADPFGGLGGFFDPIPGAGGRGRSKAAKPRSAPAFDGKGGGGGPARAAPAARDPDADDGTAAKGTVKERTRAPRGRAAKAFAANQASDLLQSAQNARIGSGGGATMVQGGGSAPAGARPDRNRDGLPDKAPRKKAPPKPLDVDEVIDNATPPQSEPDEGDTREFAPDLPKSFATRTADRMLANERRPDVNTTTRVAAQAKATANEDAGTLARRFAKNLTNPEAYRQAAQNVASVLPIPEAASEMAIDVASGRTPRSPGGVYGEYVDVARSMQRNSPGDYARGVARNLTDPAKWRESHEALRRVLPVPPAAFDVVDSVHEQEDPPNTGESESDDKLTPEERKRRQRALELLQARAI